MEKFLAVSVFLVFVIKFLVAAVLVYLVFRVMLDPALIGWFFGEIAKGFREAFQ
ncbi:MAG: hypothetical protein J0H34_20735 [Rhizobiales bacterium]|nr:hypothetical protein [Hyphomicrobiales bacterium]